MATTGDRLIDSHNGTRNKPMRVLCLGMPRTGTLSLFFAFKRLGYTPYHMGVARPEMDYWCEASDAKYHGKGKKFGRKEFDKMLGNYDALLDAPPAYFAEELVAAYPEAKVILNNREVGSWLKSMDATAGRMLRWNWDLVSSFDPTRARSMKFLKSAFSGVFGMTPPNVDFLRPDSGAAKVFTEHYELVRRVVPESNLLEYRVQEGWKPMCEFLGEEIPDEDFPKVNNSEDFMKLVHGFWWESFRKMVLKIWATVMVPTVAIGVAVWWRRYR